MLEIKPKFLFLLEDLLLELQQTVAFVPKLHFEVCTNTTHHTKLLGKDASEKRLRQSYLYLINTIDRQFCLLSGSDEPRPIRPVEYVNGLQNPAKNQYPNAAVVSSRASTMLNNVFQTFVYQCATISGGRTE